MQTTVPQTGGLLRRMLGLGGVPHAGRRRAPAVLWLPSVAVAIAMVLPLVYLVERSLDGGGEVVGLLWRMRTAEIAFRSAALVAVVTVASALIAAPLAWLTVRTDLPLRRFWSVVTVLPLVIPSYVGAFLVVVALGPRGMLQGFLESLFGIERLPDISGLWGAALTITLLSFPYTLLSVRAGLWGQDPALDEMSRSLGLGQWKTLWRVTLPQMRPSIAAGSLLVALYTLSDFGAVSLLRYETFTWAIYLQYETAFNRALAAGLSLVMIAAALSLVVLEAQARGRSRYYRAATGAARPASLVQLGPWRWPAFAFAAAVTALSLGMPLALLAYWAVRGIAAGETVELLWGNALNSVYASGLAAVVAVLAAVPVVVFTLRYPGRVSWVVERLAYTGFALPGIAVALALIFFGARFATPLYQTLALLVFAYVVLFFPQALGAIRSTYLQVSPRLSESAMSLGKSTTSILWRVTLPLMVPGMLAGGALVFLTAMKELPATLLLSPIGFGTLATSIWAAAEEAFFARAAVPALLLVAVSAVPTAFLILREPRRGQ
ncbi:MAG: iron ABC transporter permease [Chloroflexota bacterium]|nr:iron ABC transporter permease [Chloroflexota bacterium]MDE2968882.1 iron ABC transporter permease [Chloroflexota bacterium]